MKDNLLKNYSEIGIEEIEKILFPMKDDGIIFSTIFEKEGEKSLVLNCKNGFSLFLNDYKYNIDEYEYKFIIFYKNFKCIIDKNNGRIMTYID